MRTATLLVAVVALTGCSQFNMTPRCEDIGPMTVVHIVARGLSPDGPSVDTARAARSGSLTGLSELSAAYNTRTCRGTLATADGGQSMPVTVSIRQSEGAQNWVEIIFAEEQQPEFQVLAAAIQAQYGAEGP